MKKICPLIAASLLCAHAGATSSRATDELEFLRFPNAIQIAAAARADAFAWVVHQGARSFVQYAHGPDFTPVKLFEKSDADGQPISSASLSADGRFVVFQTGESAWGEKPYNPVSLVEAPELTLWAVRAVAGSQPVRIGPGTDANAAPRGALLYYRHGADLRVVSLDDIGGSQRILVHGGARFSGGSWSPDGSTLAFVQSRGSYSFIGLFRPDSSRIDWLVSGMDRVRTPKWSQDGRRIAFLKFDGRKNSVAYDLGASESFAVQVVNLADRRIRTVWQSTGPATFPYFNESTALSWAGADRLVFYSEQDGWGRLYGIGADGGAAHPITPDGCEVAGSWFAGEDQMLVVHNCPDLDTRHVSFFNIKSGARTELPGADAMITPPVGASGRYVAMTGSSADSPPLVRIVDLRDRKLVFAEDVAMHGFTFRFRSAAPQPVHFQSEDGLTVHAELFQPRTAGKHPAVVWFHGGPYHQSFPAYSDLVAFSQMYAMNRALADQGYVVLSVNYRGSTGFGRAFREDPKRAWRGASEALDAGAAARWLAARPDVEAGHIGVWGGSYGGLMTAQSLARYSDRYKAGIALYGMYDWTFSSDNAGRWDPSRDFGAANADPALALRSSPVGHLDTWKSPVLLFSGDDDIYVDIRHTVDLAQRLRERGVTVDTEMIPDESHGFVLQQSVERLWRSVSAYFAAHLGGKP